MNHWDYIITAILLGMSNLNYVCTSTGGFYNKLYQHCKGNECKDWSMLVLVVLSNDFPEDDFSTVIEFVYNATEHCNTVGSKAEVAFTYLNNDPTQLQWLYNRSDFVEYFNSDQFNYNAQLQPILPNTSLLASGIVTATTEVAIRGQLMNYSKYILVITDFELYIPANISDTLSELVNANQIRFEILQFDSYYDDNSLFKSDENYFEMISSDSSFIEVDSVDSLFTPKLRFKLFPCVSESTFKEFSLQETGASFLSTSWPYIVLICSVSVMASGMLALWWRRKATAKLKIVTAGAPVTEAAPNDYYTLNCVNWNIDDANIVVDYGCRLGSGAFSIVYKGRLHGVAPVCKIVPSVILQNTYKDCEVAVKTLPVTASEDSKADFMEEINFMKSLVYHPHLVCMLGVATAICNLPCLVLEYCSNGDLLHYVRRNKQLFIEGISDGFKQKNLIGLSWQISDGLYYLNSKDIVHRDIAARNILLDTDLTAKIGDFGLCRYADHAIYHARGGGRLPLKWMAIETLKTYEYSSKSDVWSFGVLLFEIFSLGDVPFPNVQQTKLIEHLEAGNRLTPPELCPEAMAILMQKCWIAEPNDRISIRSIREELSKMLEASTEDYGYFKLKSDCYYSCTNRGHQ